MQAQAAIAYDHFAEQRFMCTVRNLKCQKESLLIFLQLAAQQHLISPLPFVHPGDEVVRVDACICVQVCVCACISSDTHSLVRTHTRRVRAYFASEGENKLRCSPAQSGFLGWTGFIINEGYGQCFKERIEV